MNTDNQQNQTNKMNTENNITVWGNPNEKLKSQYGNVTYLEWCTKEVERMRAGGKIAKVVERKGLVAVQIA